MTQADASGLDSTQPASACTSKDKLERNMTVVRLDSDDDLRNIYNFGGKLGQGSFGTVYEAIHIETKTKWAIKEICRPAPGSSEVEMLDNEIAILQQVNHPHIICLQEVYCTTKMMYLVTELCEGGELKQLLEQKKYFTEDETRSVIHSIADAVVYLHKRDIVHRDLKLENILLKNSLDEDDKIFNIKVSDFGLSAKTHDVWIGSTMTKTCGTLIYMAPEVMSSRSYTQLCDVWSIGIIMYMLLCGEPPFVSESKKGLFEKITKGKIKFTQPPWTRVSDAAKNLLACLLKVDPANRMSAHQLLENPWITGDTDVPAVPVNVLDMMRHYREQEESGTIQATEQAAETETDSHHQNSPKQRPKRNNNFCTPSTSSNLCHGVKTKEGGGSPKQNKCNTSLDSDTQGQRRTTRSHAGPSTQTNTKQCRSQDKKDLSTGWRQSSDLSTADDQKLSTSSKVQLMPTNQHNGSKTKKRSVLHRKTCKKN
ncbi:serine/threonine-protein kinase 33 [Parambassis ranga]|uniref:Serine/threonine-protein kinase 33 n=1 Tax=Parambassis ranga TaxID=210632 RepID=A0A6P7HWQ9_9TELE|nr:serine/threonine-protein kinase 33 [Parambassis ranga]